MRAWGCDDAIPDAELLVSELVTNAVLHARSATRVTADPTLALLESIQRKVLWLGTFMVHHANTRPAAPDE